MQRFGKLSVQRDCETARSRMPRASRTSWAQTLRWPRSGAFQKSVCFSGSRHRATDAEAAYITAAGVTLLLELLNSRVDHPGYQADHTAWGLQVCTLAGAANVRLLYDIYHMQIMEGDVIRTIERALSHWWQSGAQRSGLQPGTELRRHSGRNCAYRLRRFCGA